MGKQCSVLAHQRAFPLFCLCAGLMRNGNQRRWTAGLARELSVVWWSSVFTFLSSFFPLSFLPSFLPLSLPFPPIRFEKISYHPLLSVSINIFPFTACSETSPLFSILYLGLFPYLLKEVPSSIDIVSFQEIGMIPITLKITAPSLSEGNQARSSSL